MPMLIRADHIGSFLRPPELLDARKAYFVDKRITREQLHVAEDKAILKVLDLQKQVGLPVFTDGEYRRTSFNDLWTTDLVEGMAVSHETGPKIGGWKGEHGCDADASMKELAESGQLESLTSSYVAGRLKLKRRIRSDEAPFVLKNAPGPVKLTFPGIGLWQSLGLFKPGVSDKYYANAQEITAQLQTWLRDELAALIGDGLAYIQLDSLLYVVPELIGAGFDALIAGDNSVLEGLDRSKVTVGLHMCRGNNRSAWFTSGGYEKCEKAFNELNVDRFLLEYDTERAGSLEPLRFVPRSKIVVLGLISSKVPELESMDDLLWKIDQAAKWLPIENLAISPQCGFASSAPGNLLSYDDQKRKLELVVRVAERVWGSVV
jgi:5-methyltetrahydropteroyltriglutamate--homocysteine methyltransferase